MSKVYVVQNQFMWADRDRRTHKVAKFDLKPAEKFGELVYILTPEDVPFNSQAVVKKLHDALKHITQDDFIVLIGNPSFIGWACAIASKYLDGKIKLLQWAKRDGDYRVVAAEL